MLFSFFEVIRSVVLFPLIKNPCFPPVFRYLCKCFRASDSKNWYSSSVLQFQTLVSDFASFISQLRSLICCINVLKLNSFHFQLWFQCASFSCLLFFELTFWSEVVPLELNFTLQLTIFLCQMVVQLLLVFFYYLCYRDFLVPWV